MAWQLIYTSSARLLEAGRTGFGTVARHRAISALLTGKLESISQFARLPGYDPERIIFSHRIMEAGNRSFHVLSSIRSAGSDYSGRTNHIAHHLVVSDEEVRDLSRRSVTPVDVIQAMDWRTTWDSAARFLEASEEVDLSQLQAHSFNVWAGVTGQADHARLPWSAQAGKGCSIVIPNHADASCFAGEALMHNPAKAWDISFTTHLEPNDGLSDFRWVFLYPDSAARAQAEQSARPLYDLLVPSQLPAPPAPFVQAVSAVAPSPSRQAAPLPTFAAPPPTGLDQGSQWGMDKLVDAKAGRRAIPGTPLMGAGRSATAPAQKNSRKFPLFAALVVILGVSIIAVALWKKEADRLAESRGELKQSIEGVWKNLGEPSKQDRDDLIHEAEKADLAQTEKMKSELLQAKAFIEAINSNLSQGYWKEPPSTDINSFKKVAEAARAWIEFNNQLSRVDVIEWDALRLKINEEKTAWTLLHQSYPGAKNFVSRSDLKLRDALTKKLRGWADSKWDSAKPEERRSVESFVMNFRDPNLTAVLEQIKGQKAKLASNAPKAEEKTPAKAAPTATDSSKSGSAASGEGNAMAIAAPRPLVSSVEMTRQKKPEKEMAKPNSRNTTIPIYLRSLNLKDVSQLALIPKLPFDQAKTLVIEALDAPNNWTAFVEGHGNSNGWAKASMHPAIIKINEGLVEKFTLVDLTSDGQPPVGINPAQGLILTLFDQDKQALKLPPKREDLGLAKVYIQGPDSKTILMFPEANCEASMTPLDDKGTYGIDLHPFIGHLLKHNPTIKLKLLLENSAKTGKKVSLPLQRIGDRDESARFKVEPNENQLKDKVITQKELDALRKKVEKAQGEFDDAKKSAEKAAGPSNLAKKSKEEAIERARNTQETRLADLTTAKNALTAAEQKFTAQSQTPAQEKRPEVGIYTLLAIGVQNNAVPMHLCNVTVK